LPRDKALAALVPLAGPPHGVPVFDTVSLESSAPGRLQRASGAGRIAVAAERGRTRLADLRQDGCAHIRLPRDASSADPTAILINTAGGLTGGDRLDWSAEAGPGAALSVTTQACEKIYRSLGDDAETQVSLKVGPGARLAWLPQETILFDGGRLHRRIEADVAPDGDLLIAEAVVLGRTAMGETVRTGALRDRWRIRRGGRLIFADDLRLTGDIAVRRAHAAVLAGVLTFATVLFVSPGAETRLDAARTALGESGGASAWDGKLVARLTAPDGLALRRRLIPLIEALSGRPLPRAWRL
jgi:urease accessory protein